MLSRIFPQPNTLGYLRSNFCIDTLVKARALKTAIDLGLISYVVPRESVSITALSRAIDCDVRGTQLLVDLLVASGVLVSRYEDIMASEQFVAALPYYDLICTKLSLSGYALADFSDLFSALVASPDTFRRDARIFSLFEYTAESNVDESTYRRTRLWVQLTSVLSKYEAAPFLSCYPLDGSLSILDIGGNSGAFSLQLCNACPNHTATIFDLPLVCKLGLNYVLSSPSTNRISFIAGDLRTDNLPAGFNMHIFKSFLHDWSDPDVIEHLSRSAKALCKDGKVVIFERIINQRDSAVIPAWTFCDLPILLFARSYRDPSFYFHALAVAGFAVTKASVLRLDHDFCLIEATKK